MCNEDFDIEKDLISEEVELFPRQYKGRNKKYEASRKNLIKDKRRLFSNWIESEFWLTKSGSKQLDKAILSRGKIDNFNEKIYFYGKPVSAVSFCQGIYIGPKIDKIIPKSKAYYSEQIKQLILEEECIAREIEFNEFIEELEITNEYFLDFDFLGFNWSGEIKIGEDEHNYNEDRYDNYYDCEDFYWDYDCEEEN